MHTILIPYDFSASAKNAAQYAIRLFANRPTSFIFVHLIDSLADTEVTTEREDVFVTSQLKSVVDELASQAYDSRHRFEHIVTWDRVEAGIARLAEGHSVDAILMGTKGKSNVISRFMGSVTSGVIERAGVPVMAIPLGAKYVGYRRMVLATDFRPVHDFDSYEYLMKLMKLSNAEFIVLNVEVENEPVTMERTMTGLTLDRSLQTRPHRYEFIQSDSPVHGILDFVKENKVDLVAMLKRDHYMISATLTKSVVGRTVVEIDIPLLSLPDGKNE